MQGKGKPGATELARAEWLQEGTLGLLLAAYHAERLSREAAETAGRTLRDSSVRLSSRLLGWFLEQLNQEGIK